MIVMAADRPYERGGSLEGTSLATETAAEPPFEFRGLQRSLWTPDGELKFAAAR